VNRLPASFILMCSIAPWVQATHAAPVDLYTPPGGSNSGAWAAGAHPAVVRVIAPERESMSLGSGVLVGQSEHLGLVVTNWHVVQDAAGTIMVVFPDGFRSAARLLRTDRHWDLAALAIWRPNVAPVPLAGYMPRPGEPLTIAGYGGGRYRASTGRLIDYAAPAQSFPFELLEVGTPARQGDSGGPIFNSRGEVAGVLFGTGGGRTMGSYSGRVRAFLMTVLDDFERLDPPTTMVAQQPVNAPAEQQAPQAADPVPPVFETAQPELAARPVPAVPSRAAPRPQAQPAQVARAPVALPVAPRAAEPAPARLPPMDREIPAAVPSRPLNPPQVAQADPPREVGPPRPAATEEAEDPSVLGWADLAGTTRTEQVKTVLAAIGALALLLFALRLLGEVDGSRARKAVPAAKPAARRSRRAA
jgi:hypothetical protein